MSIIFLTYAHLNFITANILLFFKIKFPHTAVRTFRTIREAAQATAFDARVNRSSKTAVFVNADRFARMIRHTLAAARRLHTAVAVAVNKPVAFTNAFMLVQIAVKAIVQRLLQALKSRILRQLQKLLDALGFNHSKSLPRFLIMVHGLRHTEFAFNRLKPDTIMRQPVFRVELNQLQKLFFA